MEVIHEDWNELFVDNKELLCRIFDELSGMEFYPNACDVFNAFRISPSEISVVLLGQDPYINKGEANGLSFSVNRGVKIPGSLRNIFKELQIEFPNTYEFEHGDLTEWLRREKIMLLNASLTVTPKQSNSHESLWKQFTDNVIKYISDTQNKKVFLLLGKYAINKGRYIDNNKHFIVTGIHPSPLSAHNGFFNSQIFIKVNELLTSINKPPIDWQN